MLVTDEQKNDCVLAKMFLYAGHTDDANDENGYD